MIILQQNLKAINTTHMYDLLRSFFSPQIPSLVANELLFLLHIFSSLKAYKTDNEKLKVSKATQKFRVKMSKWTNQNMAKFPESLILNLLFTSLFINITVFQKIHHSIYHSMFSISIFVNIIMFLVAQICRFFAIKELYIIGTKTTKSKNWISLTCFFFNHCRALFALGVTTAFMNCKFYNKWFHHHHHQFSSCHLQN